MKKIILSLLAAICFVGCAIAHAKITAEGPDVTLTPKAGSFNAISVSSSFELNYTEGNSTSISVTAPKSIAQYVKVETNGQKLNCGLSLPDNTSIDLKGRKVVVNVTAPGVKKFKASGASSITVRSPLSGGDMALKASGASSITVGNQLSASSIDIEASGASNISTGSILAKSCEIEASGASSISVDKIDAVKLEVECSGASKARISGIAKTVDIDVSGASDCDLSKLDISVGAIEASGVSTVKANSTAKNCKVSASGNSKVNY